MREGPLRPARGTEAAPTFEKFDGRLGDASLPVAFLVELSCVPWLK